MKRFLPFVALLALACAHAPLQTSGLSPGGGAGWTDVPRQMPRIVLGIRSHPLGQFESAQGAPVYLGSIIVDNTAGGLTNATTATAFNTTGAKLCNKVLLVQNVGTVDVRVLPVPASNSVVTLSRGAGNFFGVPIGVGERGIIYMPDQSMSAGCYLGAISTTSASETLDVWELN